MYTSSSVAPPPRGAPAALHSEFNFKVWGERAPVVGRALLLLHTFSTSTNPSGISNENFEIRESCKGVHCVDLGESFSTSIYYLLAKCGFNFLWDFSSNQQVT